jgi:hypothetical protein
MGWNSIVWESQIMLALIGIVGVIHPEERRFYSTILLLASYCKLLQILVSSQEKSKHPLAPSHFLSNYLHLPYHLSLASWLLFCICVCIISLLLLLFTEGRYAV